jgi:2-polyprenyl-6-hydroxyphenyl methylase/3-demethylubiquinone-9 3-methyltransferase
MTLTDSTKERFAFGQNWLQFLNHVDEARIEKAKRSFLAFVDSDGLSGNSFLDIGCGSGLSSLVARRCGMRVTAFDYDPDAVVCSGELRQKFGLGSENWTIERGDVLDSSYMKHLGQFDLVYAWGSLHHTGNLWLAVDNAASCVRDGGRFHLAVYNDQGGASRRWTAVKRFYQALPEMLRPLLVMAFVPVQWGKTVVRDTFRGNPVASWRDYGRDRGMSPWYDMVDWIGGYPFEVAKPEQVFEFLRERGFWLERLKTCGGGTGCNEYMFRKGNALAQPHSSSIAN